MRSKTGRHKFRSLLFTLIIGVGLSGCARGGDASNPATTTAQAARNEALATRQAQHWQTTLAAEALQVTATARAALDLMAARSAWPVVLSDTFDDNTNDWPSGEKDTELVLLSFFVDGQYHWEAEARDGFVYWSRPEIPDLADFYLSIDVIQTSGAEDAEAGLLIRQVDEENYYLFLISNDQYFSFERSTPDGWETIVGWTPSPAIRPGEINHLVVSGVGSDFIFVINDQFIGEAFDEHLASGKMGVVIGLFDAGDKAAVVFDNFEVKTPFLPTKVP